MLCWVVDSYQCSEGVTCLHFHSPTLYNLPCAMASQPRKLKSCQHFCQNLRSWIKSLANKDFSSSRKQCIVTNCTYTYITNTRRNNTENSKFKSTQYSLQLVWPYSDPRVFLRDQVLVPETAQVLLWYPLHISPVQVWWMCMQTPCCQPYNNESQKSHFSQK